jgi:hypothetical protein
MKPIDFTQTNKTLTRPRNTTDDECGPLQVYSDGQQCVSCWRPTFRERLSILLFGKVWLFVWSGETQPPVALAGARSPFRKEKP